MFSITKTEAENVSLKWKVSHGELGKQDEGRIGSEDQSLMYWNELLAYNLWLPVGGDPRVTS